MSDLPWDRPRFKNWLATAEANSLWHQRMQALIAPLGLRASQFDVLANLLWRPGMTQQQLAEKIFVGRSNLSMALPDLENLGWIRREADSEDKRIRRLHLTEEGERITRLALKAECELLDRMMAAFSEAECNQLGSFMGRIAEWLKSEGQR